MMHLFTEVVEKFEALKADLTGAVSKATTAVANGISFTEEELKAAEAEVFSKAEDVAEMTISKAFAAGAQWAAGRVALATAAPVAESAAATDASPSSSQPAA